MSFFCSGKTVAGIFEMSQLWESYAKAMRRRRPGSELSHNAFGRYVRRAAAFVHHTSVVIGKMDGDTFMVSHFSPRTNREGVGMLRALAAQHRVKVILAVTEDMARMLKKCGFINCNETVKTMFRGEEVVKHLFTN